MQGIILRKGQRQFKKQLTEDLEHTAYGAVELERELKKKTGNMRGAIMPVVFTSGLGVEQWNEGKWLGKLNYNIHRRRRCGWIIRWLKWMAAYACSGIL